MQSSKADQIEEIVHKPGAVSNDSSAKAAKSTKVNRLLETEKADRHKPEEMKNVREFKNEGSRHEAEKIDDKKVTKGPWMVV